MDRRHIFPRSLQYLIAIAEHGSYTRAAEVLHVSQPTLSQQIKQLEGSLGSPLLDRSGRTVRLTDAGKIYLHHVRRAWGELDAGTRAINDVQDLTRGFLRLGWTPITDYMTCSLLENFNSRYPGITLSTLEMPQDDIEVAVSEAHIDVGIVFSKPFSPEARPTEIVTDMLFKEPLCVAVGNAHPLAGKQETMSVEELGEESLVLLNTHFAMRRHLDLYCRNQDISPRIAIETNSLSVIIELIQLGALATILPISIIHSQYGLYAINVSPEIPPKAITLIYRKGAYRSPACLAFSELAADWSARRLQEIPIRRRLPYPLPEKYYQNKNQQNPKEEPLAKKVQNIMKID